MIERVKSAVEKYGLLDAGDFIIVAVSGGPDSVALLAVLNELCGEYDLKLHVAHLNHQLREKEAYEDEKFVQELARSLKLECTVERKNVNKVIKEEGLSIEEGARKVRYEFLYNLLKRYGADKIAVGHNANDQAETVLMHFLRGAGFKGLGGMAPYYECVVRPLINVTRQEIEDYCEKRGLFYRTDSTNEELIYERNKVRHHLLPVIRQYNPNIVAALGRMAEIFRSENEYMQSEAEKFLGEVIISHTSGLIEIDRVEMLKFHPSVQRRMIILCYLKLAVDKSALEFSHVEKVRNFVLEGETGKRLELPGNMILEKSYEKLFLIHKDKRPGWICRQAAVPGKTKIPGGKALTAEILPIEAVSGSFKRAAPETAYIDAGKIKWPIYIRMKNDGDVFCPLGAGGRKKLKEFFIDKKTPRYKRTEIPLIVDRKGIVWVAGYTIDERVKVTEQTKEVLFLKIEDE